MNLAYDVMDGDAESAEAIVCLPWFGTSREMTRRALHPALKGRGLRQLYLDLPGHGGSSPSTSPTSEDVLAAVIDFVEDRGSGPVLLAGCSYGGYVGAAMARRRPDLVKGLLLVCPGVTQTRDLPVQQNLPTQENWLADVPAELGSHFDRALGNRTRGVAAAVADALLSGGQGDPEYLDALQQGSGYAFQDEGDEVVFEGNVAMMTGRRDGIVGFEDHFRAMRRYPRGSYLAADLAGHYLPFEAPELLRAHVGEWLAHY